MYVCEELMIYDILELNVHFCSDLISLVKHVAMIFAYCDFAGV